MHIYSISFSLFTRKIWFRYSRERTRQKFANLQNLENHEVSKSFGVPELSGVAPPSDGGCEKKPLSLLIFPAMVIRWFLRYLLRCGRSKNVLV